MSREALKEIIDRLPEENIEPLFTIMLRFVEEVDAFPDEIEALSNKENEYIPFNVADYT